MLLNFNKLSRGFDTSRLKEFPKGTRTAKLNNCARWLLTPQYSAKSTEHWHIWLRGLHISCALLGCDWFKVNVPASRTNSFPTLYIHLLPQTLTMFRRQVRLGNRSCGNKVPKLVSHDRRPYPPLRKPLTHQRRSRINQDLSLVDMPSYPRYMPHPNYVWHSSTWPLNISIKPVRKHIKTCKAELARLVKTLPS